jgi:NAD(P)-dependent dehydrogenase (short-subunit alcohol dehydrogenase family)
MHLGLEGKRVLVTGSTAGIGLAVAVGFVRERARVILNGRKDVRLAAARERLLAAVPGADVEVVTADLSTAAGAAAITSAFPDVDVLINNVGIFEPKAFDRITDEEWLHLFETNVMSGVRLSRFYLPRMLARNVGRIVFISSESAIMVPVEMIHYGATKTTQLAIARGLAEMTSGTRVTVNAVLPGPTLSEGVGQFVADLAKNQRIDAEQVEREFFTNVRPSSLIKRFATPEEIANMIVYVASEAASATNGAALRVDGGVVRTIV